MAKRAPARPWQAYTVYFETEGGDKSSSTSEPYQPDAKTSRRIHELMAAGYRVEIHEVKKPTKRKSRRKALPGQLALMDSLMMPTKGKRKKSALHG